MYGARGYLGFVTFITWHFLDYIPYPEQFPSPGGYRDLLEAIVIVR